jgi:dolichol-phosphate mannosyltransferase
MAVLDKEELDSIQSQGYSYQVELTWRIHRNGFSIAEVPITFVERQHGASKMSGSIVKEALWRVTVWGIRSRANSLRHALKPKSTWP